MNELAKAIKKDLEEAERYLITQRNLNLDLITENQKLTLKHKDLKSKYRRLLNRLSIFTKKLKEVKS